MPATPVLKRKLVLARETVRSLGGAQDAAATSSPCFPPSLLISGCDCYTSRYTCAC